MKIGEERKGREWKKKREGLSIMRAVIFSSLFRNKESGCAELQIETRYFSQLRFIL